MAEQLSVFERLEAQGCPEGMFPVQLSGGPGDGARVAYSFQDVMEMVRNRQKLTFPHDPSGRTRDGYVPVSVYLPQPRPGDLSRDNNPLPAKFIGYGVIELSRFGKTRVHMLAPGQRFCDWLESCHEDGSPFGE